MHERTVAFDDAAMFSIAIGWKAVNGAFLFADPGDAQNIRFFARFSALAVDLMKHPWSGIVEVYIDDSLAASIDLYSESGTTVDRFFIANDLPLATHSVKLVATGRKHPSSSAAQVYFREFILFAPAGEPGFSGRAKTERDANKYGPYIESLINAVPSTEWILDCGGGDRFFGNENVINFEYLKYKNADIFGDIHKAPFAPDSFSLIISQAVFEHLANPFEAANNMRRILKPGGIAYIEVAFMQPLHAVPYHFFNMTDWGLRELFKGCETIRTGWFGQLSGTIEWLFKSVKIDEKISLERYNSLIQEVRKLDELINYEELRSVASGMYILVRKPTVELESTGSW